jgi:hypothetical protein
MEIKENLIKLFMAFISENNPDVIVSIGSTGSMKRFVRDKAEVAMDLAKNLKERGLPESEILDACFESMVKEMKPSRFNFLKDLIQNHFPEKLKRYSETGVMTYEIIQVIESHGHLFEKYRFGETETKNDLLETEFVGILFDRFENR